jgi:murein L,D-transpeptidase YcbB/YkuD
MYYNTKLCFVLATFIYGLFLSSCNNNNDNTKANSSNIDIVADPADMNENAAKKIENALLAANNTGKIDDSAKLISPQLVAAFYNQNKFSPVWSREEEWLPTADSLFDFINRAQLHGLFPEDYHSKNLFSLKNKLDNDSLLRMDAGLWAKADLILTDALIKIIKDLKYGRLQNDSLSLHKDSLLGNDFYVKKLKQIVEEKQFTAVLNAVQPKHKGYWELKNEIQFFLDSMGSKNYTYVAYPYKKGSTQDSLYFTNSLQKRLAESGCIEPSVTINDKAGLVAAIKKFQLQKGVQADGKISASLIKLMNVSDAERFKRIAITLDKYKQLPEEMPEKYIWVNLPGFYLQVWDNNSLALYSNVICGKPQTRTPLLTSNITDMVTYPTWTVPTSIIVKQYLPKLRNNPNYLSRIGLKLISNKGEKVDPGSVNWSKYSKGIPYSVMQSSGDNNALGVMKFNFDNPFSVYLHDTNQRYLFKNSYRALSHGCVRVQEWEKLAFYIANNDSINRKPDVGLKYNTDSIKTWLGKKSHRRIAVINKIPLFIVYFGCEAKNGKIQFYEDIYGEDKAFREKYFANK